MRRKRNAIENHLRRFGAAWDDIPGVDDRGADDTKDGVYIEPETPDLDKILDDDDDA